MYTHVKRGSPNKVASPMRLPPLNHRQHTTNPRCARPPGSGARTPLRFVSGARLRVTAHC